MALVAVHPFDRKTLHSVFLLAIKIAFVIFFDLVIIVLLFGEFEKLVGLPCSGCQRVWANRIHCYLSLWSGFNHYVTCVILIIPIIICNAWLLCLRQVWSVPLLLSSFKLAGSLLSMWCMLGGLRFLDLNILMLIAQHIPGPSQIEASTKTTLVSLGKIIICRTTIIVVVQRFFRGI